MKRILCVLLLLCILLTACGNNNEGLSSGELSSKKPTLPSLKETTDETANMDSSDNSSEDTDNEEVTAELTGSFNVVTKTYKSEAVDSTKSSLLINKQNGKYDAETLARREEILNTEDNLDLTGMTVYYASPSGDNNNDGLSPETPLNGNEITNVLYLLKPGTALLFERGCIYRPGSLIEIQTHDIVIGAYGKGAKPAIYGSLYNYAEKLWQPSKTKNVWRTSVRDASVGNIVFNHGEDYGWMKYGIKSLMKDGDFYHNAEEGYFYLYCSKGNPSDVWYDIEICPDRSGIGAWGGGGVYNVVVDNLSIKYFARHGIQFYGQHKNVTITNCEVGWIGGALQNRATFLRYGNGIEFYGGGCENIYVKNNWVYQTYDSGITIQSGAVSNDAFDGGCGGWKNIHFENNVVEYQEANLEIWNSKDSNSVWYRNMMWNGENWVKRDVPLTDEIPEDEYRTFGFFQDIYLEGNILRFAGYGWSNDQRPLKNPMAITMAFSPDSAYNYNVKNNVFDFPRGTFITWTTPSFSVDKVTAIARENTVGRGLNISGNSYYMKDTTSSLAVTLGVSPQDQRGTLLREKYASNYGREYDGNYYVHSLEELKSVITKHLDSNPKAIEYYK